MADDSPIDPYIAAHQIEAATLAEPDGAAQPDLEEPDELPVGARGRCATRAEVAQALGISPGEVAAIEARALGKLRLAMERSGVTADDLGAFAHDDDGDDA